MAYELTYDLLDLVAKMPRRTGEAPAAEARKETPLFSGVFNAATSDVVKSVRRTRFKLERLSQLVRRSSLFEDATDEISGLIHSANEEVTQASTRFRAAKSELAKASEYARQKRDKTAIFNHVYAMEAATQTEIEETSRFFKALLRRRSETMRRMHERREVFGAAKNDDEDKKRPKRTRVPVFDDLPRPSSSSETPQVTSQAQMELLIPDQTYHTSRASATRDIEGQVQEIGSIFGKLTSLISQQEEQIERIEANVEDTDHNVSASADVLRDRLSSMSDTTTTAIKVAGILAATAVIYTIFLA